MLKLTKIVTRYSIKIPIVAAQIVADRRGRGSGSRLGCSEQAPSE